MMDLIPNMVIVRGVLAIVTLDWWSSPRELKRTTSRWIAFPLTLLFAPYPVVYLLQLFYYLRG